MRTQKSDLEKWVSEFSGKHCLDCTDNCCNGTKQLINIDLESLELFKEAGVPRYLIRELDRDSVIKWLEEGALRGLRDKSSSHFIGDVHFKDGSVVKKPAVILAPRIEWYSSIDGVIFEDGYCYVLYVEKYCPFYTEGSGCRVYWHPNRPSACKSYPLDIHENKNGLAVRFHKSCPSSLKGIAEIEQRFPNINFRRI